MRKLKLSGPSEAEFTRMVLELARLHGWRSAHFRPAQTSKGWRTAVSGDGKGFVDLILVRGHRMIGAELKVGRNKTTPEQDEWLKALGDAGVAVFVWTPQDWDEIVKTLEAA